MEKTYYHNQTAALIKINEVVNCSVPGLYKYEQKGIVSGPDCIYVRGKMELPGYSDERVALIIKEIQEYRKDMTMKGVMKSKDRENTQYQ
jgi:hypothetical protein